MEAPNLKLTVEKGPKAGEARECKPSSKIRIGRVVKGNNFQIKDEGISSKHLLIELNNTNSKWVLSDLGSSNGTFLNSVQLDAFKEYVLKNGDIIKIGEETSMKVTIEGGEQELRPKQAKGAKKTAKSGVTVSASTSTAAADDVKEVDGGARQLRRNARRGVAAAVAPVVEKVPQGRRGRARKGNVVELEESVSVGVTVLEIGAKDEASNVGVGEASKSVEVLGEERVSVKEEPCDEYDDAVPSSTGEKSPQLEGLTLAKLEKMTLGEWFDYLEVYLVRQIREETDEIIKGMVARAEQYKQYMSEQQKLKSKSTLP